MTQYELIPMPRRETAAEREAKDKLVRRMTDFLAYCDDTSRPMPEGVTVEPIPAAEPEFKS